MVMWQPKRNTLVWADHYRNGHAKPEEETIPRIIDDDAAKSAYCPTASRDRKTKPRCARGDIMTFQMAKVRERTLRARARTVSVINR